MQRSIRLSLSLGSAAALALANTSFLPAAAQEADTAEDLGDVMSISLKDVVKPNIGFQGALQGAGTPNQAGVETSGLPTPQHPSLQLMPTTTTPWLSGD